MQFCFLIFYKVCYNHGKYFNFYITAQQAPHLLDYAIIAAKDSSCSLEIGFGVY